MHRHGCQAELALADHGHDARDVVAHLGNLARVLELADRVLESELVKLASRGLHAVRQLVLLQLPELVDLHWAPPAATDSEVTKRVLIGSFEAANFMASLATWGVTPPISKRMRPGRTTATQPSGLPLPEPIRVSAGFLVIDLSGTTRIQTWPPRLTCLVMARRAASIWRLVIQQASTACRPKSPKATVAPRVAMPWRRPRCILRYLTRFGINIRTSSWSWCSSWWRRVSSQRRARSWGRLWCGWCELDVPARRSPPRQPRRSPPRSPRPEAAV